MRSETFGSVGNTKKRELLALYRERGVRWGLPAVKTFEIFKYSSIQIGQEGFYNLNSMM